MFYFVLAIAVSISILFAIAKPLLWIFACGMILFLISNIIMAIEFYSGSPKKGFLVLNRTTYYLSIALIFSSTILIFV